MILKRKKFNPKLSVLKLMGQFKFQNSTPKQRIAYANLMTDKVTDLCFICELDLTLQQILDLADDYKKVGKIYKAKFGKIWVTLALSGGGPASMEFVCTSLIAAGAKKIVHVGVCGSLKNNISIGDVVLAESAYVNDDTSKYHAKEKIITCNNTTSRFIKEETKKIAPKDLKIHHCQVVSGSTLFGQTIDLLKSWSKLGDVTNLETATCFAICQKNKATFAGVYMVTDDKIRGYDFFTMKKFPMALIFDHGDLILRGIVQGIRDYGKSL